MALTLRVLVSRLNSSGGDLVLTAPRGPPLNKDENFVRRLDSDFLDI